MKSEERQQPVPGVLKSLLAILTFTLVTHAQAATTTKTINATSNATASAVAMDDTTEAPIDDTAPTVEKDPYEGFNRAMFTFNDKLDIYVLKPIATFYNKVMPKPLNKGIHNVFENINTVPTIANDLLQANFYQASNDTGRLLINTTIGIGGLFDMATRMDLEPYSNDFGLTLARWGYSDSNYLVLPFFGPNTVRDGLIGLPVDYFAFSLYPYIEPPSFRYQVYILGAIDKRAQLLKFQDVVDEASLDKYVFMRNAYLQRRAFQIDQNNHRSCCDRYTKPAEINSRSILSPKPLESEIVDLDSPVPAANAIEPEIDSSTSTTPATSTTTSTENYD